MRIIRFKFGKYFGEYDLLNDIVSHARTRTRLARAEIGIKQAIWLRAIAIVKAQERNETSVNPRVAKMRVRKAIEGDKTRSYMMDRDALEAIEWMVRHCENKGFALTKNQIVNNSIVQAAKTFGYTPQNVSGDTQ